MSYQDSAPRRNSRVKPAENMKEFYEIIKEARETELEPVNPVKYPLVVVWASQGRLHELPVL